jgi:tripartite-type tricarboxylate transporter receptor subunit TctC
MMNVKLPRRQFLQLAASAAALPAASRIARAQAYPTRPVRILCGYPPGGVTDIYARITAQWLSERLGQQFIVENKPGAGGTIAAESLVRAAPDGHTLLLATSSDAWNATLYPNLKFNFAREVAAVAPMARGPGILVVHPSVPLTSVPELIAYTKANPKKLAVASSGIGSGPHMYWELFRSATGIDMLHVPYRGGGPAITDLLGAQVLFRDQCLRDRICQVGSAAATGRDHGRARDRLARGAGHRRISARVRGEQLCRRRGAPQRAGRHRRKT